MHSVSSINKRVVIIHWKDQKDNPFEVFSNLKNLCISYPQYNYNTLSNYLSKEKIPYENDHVRIERKNIISQPKQNNAIQNAMKIVPVVRKVLMKDADESRNDLDYWLSQPVQKRVAAVTFIIYQSLKQGERMDKTFFKKQKIKA